MCETYAITILWSIICRRRREVYTVISFSKIASTDHLTIVQVSREFLPVLTIYFYGQRPSRNRKDNRKIGTSFPLTISS